ncbi:MAG: lipase family alpha/beta hydrolase [Myxococcota bacterium]
MVNAPTSPRRLYRALRDQLGSIRKVYGRGNRVVRRDDFARHEEAVLLLHGFFQTRNVWEVMEDRLRYDGFGVFSFDLGGLFARFNTERPGHLAEHIAEKIERICTRTGLDSFHVVGHSKGGLIAREYVQHFGGDARVKSLITLGTPHHGTPTAALGVWLMGAGILSRSPYDLLPNSRFVQRLRENPFPSSVPLVSVYSRHDIVCPWWSSVLVPREGETSLHNRPVQGVGHTALTYDPGVYQIVRREILQAAALWKQRRAQTPGLITG